MLPWEQVVFFFFESEFSMIEQSSHKMLRYHGAPIMRLKMLSLSPRTFINSNALFFLIRTKREKKKQFVLISFAFFYNCWIFVRSFFFTIVECIQIALLIANYHFGRHCLGYLLYNLSINCVSIFAMR